MKRFMRILILSSMLAGVSANVQAINWDTVCSAIYHGCVGGAVGLYSVNCHPNFSNEEKNFYSRIGLSLIYSGIITALVGKYYCRQSSN